MKVRKMNENKHSLKRNDKTKSKQQQTIAIFREIKLAISKILNIDCQQQLALSQTKKINLQTQKQDLYNLNDKTRCLTRNLGISKHTVELGSNLCVERNIVKLKQLVFLKDLLSRLKQIQNRKSTSTSQCKQKWEKINKNQKYKTYLDILNGFSIIKNRFKSQYFDSSSSNSFRVNQQIAKLQKCLEKQMQKSGILKAKNNYFDQQKQTKIERKNKFRYTDSQKTGLKSATVTRPSSSNQNRNSLSSTFVQNYTKAQIKQQKIRSNTNTKYEIVQLDNKSHSQHIQTSPQFNDVNQIMENKIQKIKNRVTLDQKLPEYQQRNQKIINKSKSNLNIQYFLPLDSQIPENSKIKQHAKQFIQQIKERTAKKTKDNNFLKKIQNFYQKSQIQQKDQKKQKLKQKRQENNKQDRSNEYERSTKVFKHRQSIQFQNQFCQYSQIQQQKKYLRKIHSRNSKIQRYSSIQKSIEGQNIKQASIISKQSKQINARNKNSFYGGSKQSNLNNSSLFQVRSKKKIDRLRIHNRRKSKLKFKRPYKKVQFGGQEGRVEENIQNKLLLNRNQENKIQVQKNVRNSEKIIVHQFLQNQQEATHKYSQTNSPSVQQTNIKKSKQLNTTFKNKKQRQIISSQQSQSIERTQKPKTRLSHKLLKRNAIMYKQGQLSMKQFNNLQKQPIKTQNIIIDTNEHKSSIFKQLLQIHQGLKAQVNRIQKHRDDPFSAFYTQQQYIKQAQQRNMYKQIGASNKSSKITQEELSRMFNLQNSETSKILDRIQQYQRYYTFSSDGQWIKNHYFCDKFPRLLQKLIKMNKNSNIQV